MISIWEKPLFQEYDYIIIGSGITGLSTAASLLEQQPHANVLVLERGIFPTGASTRNAGFVCFGSAGELLHDISQYGKEKALSLVEMRIKGMRRLLQRLPHNQIEFKQYGGYELLRPQEEQIPDKLDYLNKLLQPLLTTARAGSNKPVFSIDNKKLHTFGFNRKYVRNMVVNPYEGQLHPGKMIRALQKLVSSRGATILTGIEVTGLRENPAGVVITAKGASGKNTITFFAGQAAICTNAFAKSLHHALQVVPGRGQVIVTTPIEGLPFRGTFHLEEGFYYFRNYGKCVIFGGGRNMNLQSEETTDFGNTEQITAKLEQLLREVILPGKKFTKQMEWSGIMGFTPDKRPLVKRLGTGTVCGVGLSGMGIAMGSEVGHQLAKMMAE